MYRQIGGHAYGWVYSGPIGAVLTPLLQADGARACELAHASSLCAACDEACPVEIPLHDLLLGLRRDRAERRIPGFLERTAYTRLVVRLVAPVRVPPERAASGSARCG